MTFTYPISQYQIRESIKAATAFGQAALEDFKDRVRENKSGYNVNWGDLSLSSVELTFDEDANSTLTFTYSEGNCHAFNDSIYQRLLEIVPPDFGVVVRSEW